jgi:hypothetical protein
LALSISNMTSPEQVRDASTRDDPAGKITQGHSVVSRCRQRMMQPVMRLSNGAYVTVMMAVVFLGKTSMF